MSFNEVVNAGKYLYEVVELTSKNNLLFALKNDGQKVAKAYLNYHAYVVDYIKLPDKCNCKEKYFKRIVLSQVSKVKRYDVKIRKLMKKLIKRNVNTTEDLYHLKLLLKRNEKNLVILNNMIYSYENFRYNVDHKKYKKLDYKDLKFGDIVLTLKSDEMIKKKIIFKLIYFVTKSHIGHASQFFKQINGKYYFLDVPEVYNPLKKIKYKLFNMNYSKKRIGLVLRYNKKFTPEQKENLKKYYHNNLGSSFGLIKALFLALELEMYFHMPFFRNLKNPFPKESHFCSENVVRAYETAGIYLSNKDDEATTSPVDLLNSPQLKVIGYIDKKQV